MWSDEFFLSGYIQTLFYVNWEWYIWNLFQIAQSSLFCQIWAMVFFKKILKVPLFEKQSK